MGRANPLRGSFLLMLTLIAVQLIPIQSCPAVSN
jgi:hypothetical protein